MPKRKNHIVRLLIWTICLVAGASSVYAKPNKYAIKTSKVLAKEGWKAFEGDPSLVDQLDLCLMYDYAYSPDAIPVYLRGEAQSEVFASIEDAKEQALDYAKVYLCELLLFEVDMETSGDFSSSETEKITHTKSLFMGETFCERTDITKYDNTTGISTTMTSISNFNWDVIRRTCFSLPLVKNADVVLRAYKRENTGYRAMVVVYSETAKASGTKIGDLYYDLNPVRHTAELSYSPTYKDLTNIEIPTTVTYDGIQYDVTCVAYGALYNGDKLRDIRYPKQLDLSQAKVPSTAKQIAY